MNLSFFHFWGKVRPSLVSLIHFMRPRLKEKLSHEERVRQLIVWAIPMFFIAAPAMKFCLYMANLSPVPLVQAFWTVISLLFGFTGLLSFVMLLLAILILSILLTGNALKKVTSGTCKKK